MPDIRLADPFFPTLFERVMKIMKDCYDRATGCEYEHPESSYGAGDALPCGKDAVQTEDGARCRLHIARKP